ncbi:hypothetical protein STCU_05270 [Strigomonas culicis]|uniref:Uncharacterized protein n=1 Tax=Strigomonas culicis TaxID=28005 RepID=S9UBK1_9TRYP|nr:hypothetical protein STCU_05270 [Strigomonas culicis]|eukprot:EPY28162.1 hypothetical protein STCU_05270 [Strigomonas culicis]
METFFRISLAEISDQEWLRIVQLEIKERSELLEQADQFSSESFLLSLPPIMQVVVRGFLWICLTVMSFFFLIGTFFIALVGVLSSLYIFFCMFSKPYYVFLYGTAFIVVAVQFTLFCSRGFDIARNTFNGRLIQALKAFGSKALIFQGVIYVGCTVGCFVVFCVMATRFDVLTGIQYSVAYGWVVAVCLTFIYHVAFAFGFKEISKRSYSSGSRVNNAETTLYLFMDIDMDDAHLFRRAPSEVILLSFLGVLAFASGVSFMAGGSFFFLTGAIVMTAAVLFLSVIVLSTNNSSPSATLTICSVFYGCIFWMGAVFTMSREGWHNNYGDALLATLFVMLFFVISCFVSTYGPWKGRRRRWLFRMAWLLLLSHLVACVVALIVYNYRMGLFVMALALHLLVCIFRTNEASNVYGVCLMATGFVFALLACCLIANYDHQQIYSGSASGSLLPSFASSVIDDSSETSSVFPPICTTRFAKSSLDIVSMALFSKMSYNSDLTSMEKDMNTWFPDFTSVTSLDQGVNDVLKVTMFRRRASSMNTTILSVRTGENLLATVTVMTMFIDQYCMSFFSFLMPPSYLVSIMPYISFVRDMSPIEWKPIIESSATLLEGYISDLSQNETVFLVGHGTLGALSGAAALQSNSSVKSVIFASPELLTDMYSRKYTDLQISQRVLVTRSQRSVYNSWYLRSASEQMLPCEYGGRKCDSIDTIVQLLDQLCRV